MEQQPKQNPAYVAIGTCPIERLPDRLEFSYPKSKYPAFVVLSAVLVKCGYAAGIVSGLIANSCTPRFLFSTDHSFFLYTIFELSKLIVIGLGIAANILLIGRLQWQFELLQHGKDAGRSRGKASRNNRELPCKTLPRMS
ncbi:MAG: hypothetical protein ACLVBX_05980 [Faecalibacterium prausnitzii]